MLLTVVLAGTFLFLLSFFVGLKITEIHRLFLADIQTPPQDFHFPPVTIVLAGRDEEKQIGEAVSSMTALSYPDLRVVAVNDRSSDKTGEILDRIAAGNERLKVVHITSLPDGWLGKTNALHAAYESLEPGGGWILFTDADVKFAPDALKKAIFYAESNRIDHLVVYPEMEVGSTLEKAFLAVFGLLLTLDRPSWLVENPKSKKHIGIGAFNLVRRRCIETIDGFRHIALSVDDDLRLGQLLKASGFRPKVAFGKGQVSLRWQENILAYLRGFEKNAFGSLDFRIWMLLYAVAGTFAMTVLPLLTLVISAPSAAKTFAVAIIILQAAILLEGRRANDTGPQYVALIPLGGILIIASLVLSAWATLKNNGIIWRGTKYPLSALKNHVRRRNLHVAEIRRKTPHPTVT